MANRGRPPKLDRVAVEAIRYLLRTTDISNKELQAKYGITYLTLRKVKKGLHPYEFVDENQGSDPQ